MSRLLRASILFSVLCTLVSVNGAGVSAQDWYQVAYWQGQGAKTTEPFTILGDVWRITFTMRNPRSTRTQVCIEVRQPPDAYVTGGCNQQDDTTYVYQGAGTYYLRVSSSDQWTISIEDNTPGGQAIDPDAGVSWRRIQSWQGGGARTTEPFVVNGDHWRMAVTMRNSRGSTTQVCVEVRRPPDAYIAGGCNQQDATTYVYDGAGTYYLRVSSSDQWTIVVEDSQ
jgi:hypothetical protein